MLYLIYKCIHVYTYIFSCCFVCPICVYMNIYIYICIYIYHPSYLYLGISCVAHMHIYVLCIYIHNHVYYITYIIHTPTYMYCIYTYLYIYAYVYSIHYICIYIRTYIVHVHTYTYIYVYTYIYTYISFVFDGKLLCVLTMPVGYNLYIERAESLRTQRSNVMFVLQVSRYNRFRFGKGLYYIGNLQGEAGGTREKGNCGDRGGHHLEPAH